jgi:hypothetical protein
LTPPAREGSIDLEVSTMNCPECGKPVPPGVSRCPSCNAVVRERASAAPKKPWALVGVLTAIVVVLLVLLARSWLNRGPDVTAAPAPTQAPAGPPLTQAPAPKVPEAGPPVTAAPSQPPPAPPKEDPDKAAVEAYLRQVSAIEKQRQDIVNDTAQLLVMLQVMKAMAGGLSNAQMDQLLAVDAEEEAAAKEKAKQQTSGQVMGQMQSYSGRLRALDQQFRAIKVPKPAYAFAASYDNALARYVAAIDSLAITLQKAEGVTDPAQATAVITQLQQARSQLTAAVAQGLSAADGQLAALCSKYGIPKPFTVADAPPGDLTGLGG